MFAKNFRVLVFCIATCFFVACSGGSKETQQMIPKERYVGTPLECSDKLRSKDSVEFYSCCENLNACWYPKRYTRPFGDSIIYHTYGDSITYHAYGDSSIIYKDILIRQKFYLIDTVKIITQKELLKTLERIKKENQDKALEFNKNRSNLLK